MDEQGKLDERLINSLRSRLKETEETLTTSASYGKKLLDENIELKQKLANCTKNLDELLQMNHNLKMDNSNYSNDVQHLRNEIDLLTDQLKNKQKLDENELEKEAVMSKQYIEELEKQISELRLELNVKCEYVNALEKQGCSQSQEEKSYSQKIVQLEQLLQEMEETNCQSIEEKKQLKANLHEKEQLLEDANDCVRNLQQTIESLQNQLTEKSLQSTSTYESLKNAQSEISDLQTELQLARTTTAEVDLNKRGNSLFSEVDDRRVKIENLVLQLKNKCKALTQELEEKQKKFEIMRMDLSALHLASSRKVNPAIVEELERELDKAQKEIKSLLASHEANIVCQSPTNMQTLVSNETISMDPEYRCLRLLLHQTKSQMKELETEIRDMWSERVIGRQQRKEYRRKILCLEQEIGSLKAELLKFKSLNDSLTAIGNHKENLSSGDLTEEQELNKISGTSSKAIKTTHNLRSTQSHTNALKSKKTVQECQTQ